MEDGTLWRLEDLDELDGGQRVGKFYSQSLATSLGKVWAVGVLQYSRSHTLLHHIPTDGDPTLKVCGEMPPLHAHAPHHGTVGTRQPKKL